MPDTRSWSVGHKIASGLITVIALVYLNAVRWHDGARYYARMAVRFWYAGKWRWDVGWFRSGYWVFPPVFPYL